jgi:hypothetical protein
MVNTDMMGQMIAMVPVPTQAVYPGQMYPGGAASPQPYAPMNQPAYSQSPPAYGQPGGYQPVPTAQAISPGAPRFINVVVPPGVEPGSLLTVSTPEGQTIQITVPSGAYAGYEFKVQY